MVLVALWPLLASHSPAQPDTNPASTPSSTLINIGDTWSYLSLPYQVHSPAPQWTQLHFDDSQWSMTDSGVDLEHRHISPQETLPAKMPHRVFVRRKFTVTNPAAIHSLRLKLEFEHGYKVYLNGTAVAESKADGMSMVKIDPYLPTDEETFLDVGDLDLTAQKSLLVRGENILAIEGDQSFPIRAPVTLAGLLTANISRGPFLQSMTSQGVIVVWRTDLEGQGAVEFGTTPMLGKTAEGISTTRHAVKLSGLSPGTRYYYRVRTTTPEGNVFSDIRSFRTFRDEGPVSFMFFADSGQGSPDQLPLAQLMSRTRPDLVIHGGDIIYGGFDDKTPDTRVFAYYQRDSGMMQSIPFYFSIGNHDLNCCGGFPDWNPTNWVLNATNFQNTFYLPTNSVTGTEHFYSFDSGDAHFVALYNPWYSSYVLTNTSDQMRWLTNDLAQTKKPWKILFFHSPPSHSGLHATADRNLNQVLDQLEVNQVIMPIAERYGVQFILCGHDHIYERFRPTNGVYTIVSGGGGASLYSLTKRHPLSAFFFNYNTHFVNVEIQGSQAVVRTTSRLGVQIDQFVVNHSPNLDPVYNSTWNTPAIETGPANDNDGNIVGQTFNLMGQGIAAQAGRQSNLGWSYLNNDADNLYLGFSSSMIPPEGNLFVFLEGPRSTGVSNLGGLGNNLIDPDGEGVDGLDCLQNLFFYDFSPSVACILGDEFADGQFRSWKRPMLSLNVGQGAFRLEPGLPSLPNARIQQFDRTPQSQSGRAISEFGVLTEQNADYIEVAIPLSSLGGALPGDEVKVGAIVGLAGFDTNSMTREIDSGGLGIVRRFPGSGSQQGTWDTTVLAPIRVRLSEPPNRDSDGDGLPNAWEMAHGLNPDSGSGDNGADGDPDHDGFTNGEEYLAGTDPMDTGSHLQLTLNLLSQRKLELEWNLQPGKRYKLQALDRSMSGFVDLVNTNLEVTALPRKVYWIEDFGSETTSTNRIYRLKLD